MMDIDAALASLEKLSPAELRAHWSAVTGAVVPRASPKLLRLALAWEIQAKIYGGHSREVTRLLGQHEHGLTNTARSSPGIRLIREWQGHTHVVTIGEDQVIRWDGREWRSLSEVAREITGTRWSGPAFFRLKKKVVA